MNNYDLYLDSDLLFGDDKDDEYYTESGNFLDSKITRKKTITESTDFEEFCLGSMSPVTHVSNDDILSKEKLDNYDDIDSEYDALDLGLIDDKDDESLYYSEPVVATPVMTEEKHNGIDDDIEPIIRTLNNKGYKTKYSCSGHPSSRMKKDNFRDGVYRDKLYSSARIVFADNYDIGDAPKYWDEKKLNNNQITSLYVAAPNFKITDGLPKEAFYKWKQNYMNSLKKWADDLPEQGKGNPDEVKIEESYDDLYVPEELEEINPIVENVLIDAKDTVAKTAKIKKLISYLSKNESGFKNPALLKVISYNPTTFKPTGNKIIDEKIRSVSNGKNHSNKVKVAWDENVPLFMWVASIGNSKVDPSFEFLGKDNKYSEIYEAWVSTKTHGMNVEFSGEVERLYNKAFNKNINESTDIVEEVFDDIFIEGL